MDGQRLRQLRKSKGLTQPELADATGVPQQTISNYERMHPGEGKTRVSRIAVQSLAGYFGVTARYLLGETDNPEYDVNGTDGERSRQQLEAIHDALPPSLQPSLVELGRGLLRLAQEQERSQGETEGREPEEPSS